MRFFLDKKDKSLPEGVERTLTNLEKGKYLIIIHSLDTTTESVLRRYYFTLVDNVSSFSGDTNQVIHTRFKKHQEINSTKDFKVEDWKVFIDDFKQYIFYKLDYLL